jgi:hypothetical protein
MTHHHPWLPAKDCSPAQLQEYLLRHHLPGSWLRGAAEVATVHKDSALLQAVGEHGDTPADVRHHVVRALSWQELLGMLGRLRADAEATADCQDQLIRLWARMDAPAMKAFAELAPCPFWDLIWRTAKPAVLARFLTNPALGPATLKALIQPPLTHDQAEALRNSQYLEHKPMVVHVLTTMARSFQDPATDLVLGLVAPWLKILTPQERLALAASLPYPPMERLAQLWGTRLSPPA